MKKVFFPLWVVATFFLPPVVAAQPEVIFATTTSVQDTGLLDVIIPLFEKQSGYRVKPLAVGTGQALAMAARGEADVVLAHAPAAEKKYVADGSLMYRRLVMYNTFLLAGPASDPAHVKGARKAVAALQQIAAAKATFVSRGDDSGTHQLEMKLWRQAGITPAGAWYLQSGQGMGNTLRIADEKQGYVITDRATYLAFQHTTGLAVVLDDDPLFLNLYHVMEVNPAKLSQVNARGGKALADFLVSTRVQDILKTFGQERFGEPLFRPAAGQTEATLLP